MGLTQQSSQPHEHRPAEDAEGQPDRAAVPVHRIPKMSWGSTPPTRSISSELLLDGQARLNLATFVTTWMPSIAGKLMAETADKNMIDKDEYPQTAEIEARCVNILADLWTRRSEGTATGCSTTGSSEAAMLAGMALKWRWRERMQRGGQADRQAEPGDGRQRPGVLGEVLPLLGGRAAAGADGGRPLPPRRRGGGGAVRREHDRGGGDPRLDVRRQLRAGRRRSPPRSISSRTIRAYTSRPRRRRVGRVRRPVRRSPISSGTSASRECSRSTPRATSTGWSTPESGGRSGATRRRCRRIWCSTSTTSAATCRRSR